MPLLPSRPHRVLLLGGTSEIGLVGSLPAPDPGRPATHHPQPAVAPDIPLIPR